MSSGWSGTRRAVASVSVALAAAMLAGCVAADPASTATPVPAVTVTITPEPVVVTITPTPEPAPVVEAEPAPPPEPAPVVLPAPPPPPEPEPIVLTEPTDAGSAPHASGTVEPNASGVPSRYTVATGDIAVEICTRFNRWIWQLEGEDGNPLADPFHIFPGDIIILTADAKPTT